MKILFLLIILLSSIFAKIEISGDARVRPRLDIIETGEPTSDSDDFYFLYRARLNINSDIGDGYFFNSKLGSNSPAGFKKMGKGVKVEDENYDNQGLDFVELYFGYKKEKSGLWGGLLPIKHNSAMDIHFYPNKLLDIPWVIWNNSTITGFAGYQQFSNHKFNWFLSVDNQRVDNIDGTNIELNDDYTFGINSTVKIGELNFNPHLLYAISDENSVSPITFGSDFHLPNIGVFTSSLSFFKSMNSNLEKYEIDHFRFKLNGKINEGMLNFFFDIATKNQTEEPDRVLKYIWASYSYKWFNGEFGDIVLRPTIRIQNGSITNENYLRTKFELTMEIRFK